MKRDKGSLVPRIITALFLIPLVLAAVAWTSPVGVWLLSLVCALLAVHEAAMLQRGQLSNYSPALLFLILTPFTARPAIEMDCQGVLAALWAVEFAAIGLYFRRRSTVPRLPAALLASVWCAVPFAMLVILHQLGGPRPSAWRLASPVLEVVLPLWAGDTAAYFVGRAWGKRLLAPTISPKKTIEGAIANLVASVAMAIPVGIWIGRTWLVGLACGLAIGVFGQLGDLFESYVKRQAGVKDSGKLLPGHGGVLDRIDSLLFAAPVVALILTFS